jgi:hypothetical protein
MAQRKSATQDAPRCLQPIAANTMQTITMHQGVACAGLVLVRNRRLALRDRPRVASGRDLDRAFMVMGCAFCLTATFALAFRDSRSAATTRACLNVAMVLTAGGSSRWRSAPRTGSW